MSVVLLKLLKLGSKSTRSPLPVMSSSCTGLTLLMLPTPMAITSTPLSLKRRETFRSVSFCRPAWRVWFPSVTRTATWERTVQDSRLGNDAGQRTQSTTKANKLSSSSSSSSWPTSIVVVVHITTASTFIVIFNHKHHHRECCNDHHHDLRRCLHASHHNLCLLCLFGCWYTVGLNDGPKEFAGQNSNVYPFLVRSCFERIRPSPIPSYASSSNPDFELALTFLTSSLIPFFSWNTSSFVKLSARSRKVQPLICLMLSTVRIRLPLSSSAPVKVSKPASRRG